MTTPAPPGGLTWEAALLAAAAARAALFSGDAVASTVAQLAESVITAREKAIDWVLALLNPRLADLDVYDGHAVQDFTETAAGYMETAQTVIARAASAAQHEEIAAMGFRFKAVEPSNPLDVRGTPVFNDDGSITIQRGTSRVEYSDGKQVVDLDQDASTVGIFNRPARVHRYLESQGATREQAAHAAAERMSSLVDGNVMLAQRFAESEVIFAAADLDSSPVVGMRRIIHPELSRTGVCGLCIAASDRLYTVRELLPMHLECKCTSAAVTEDHDPADELNRVDLGQLYRDAGGTSGAHLKRTAYKIDQHGELGPTVVPKKEYKPRGANAQQRAAATAVSDPETKAEVAARHLPILEQNLQRLKDAGLSEESSQVKYHREQIDKLRAALISI